MAVRKLLLTAFVAITAAAGFSASAQQVVRKKLAPVTPDMDELVIVGNDTVPIVIPERNFGRYDRGLYNYLFIPKGKWSFGLTASYGELNTDDVQVLSIQIGRASCRERV